MPKTAIITDTDSSIHPQLAEEMGIVQIPITIHFDTEAYTTNEDIDDNKLFQLIDQKNRLPTTAAPAPRTFELAYRHAFEQKQADAILCITVSSKVSATYNAALQAAEAFPDRDITVIDSLQLCMGQGLIVLEAARLARQGAPKAEILAAVESLRSRIHVLAVLPTLKYLAMGGRIGKLSAGLADAFNIKPILSVKDGKLELLEKVRTEKKAGMRVMELAETFIQGKAVEHLAIVHANNPEGAQKLSVLMKEKFNCPQEILFAEFTPGLSVHTGAGVVGFALVTGK